MSVVVADPVVARVKSALQQLYGTRLERVLLYGSRARGSHRADSDYDFIAVLRGPYDLWAELQRIAPLLQDMLAAGTDVSVKPFTADELSARTAFMYAVRRDAVEV